MIHASNEPVLCRRPLASVRLTLIVSNTFALSRNVKYVLRVVDESYSLQTLHIANSRCSILS